MAARIRLVCSKLNLIFLKVTTDKKKSLREYIVLELQCKLYKYRLYSEHSHNTQKEEDKN